MVAIVLTVCICTRLEKEAFVRLNVTNSVRLKRDIRDNIELNEDEICQTATSTLKNSWTTT